MLSGTKFTEKVKVLQGRWVFQSQKNLLLLKNKGSLFKYKTQKTHATRLPTLNFRKRGYKWWRNRQNNQFFQGNLESQWQGNYKSGEFCYRNLKGLLASKSVVESHPTPSP
jgi:hypothetical protein